MFLIGHAYVADKTGHIGKDVSLTTPIMSIISVYARQLKVIAYSFP